MYSLILFPQNMSYFVISMYSLILFLQNMSYNFLWCLFCYYYSKIEDSDLNVLQYWLCGITLNGDSRKHFDILDFPWWKLEVQFVFLSLLYGEKTNSKKRMFMSSLSVCLRTVGRLKIILWFSTLRKMNHLIKLMSSWKHHLWVEWVF